MFLEFGSPTSQEDSYVRFHHKVQNVLRYPFCTATAGGILFRQGADGLEVLTGIRHGNPWNGFIEIESAGFMDPGDRTPRHTAEREVKEETGGQRKKHAGVVIEIQYLVGIYGPERLHHVARLDKRDPAGFVVQKTRQPAQRIPVLHFTFAGVVQSGKVLNTREQSHHRWRLVRELVEHDGDRLAFDSAHALRRLVILLKPGNERLRRVAHESLSLIV